MHTHAPMKMLPIPWIRYISRGINAIPGFSHKAPYVDALLIYVCLYLQKSFIKPFEILYRNPLRVLQSCSNNLVMTIYISQSNTIKSNTQSLPMNSSTVFFLTYWNSIIFFLLSAHRWLQIWTKVQFLKSYSSPEKNKTELNYFSFCL